MVKKHKVRFSLVIVLLFIFLLYEKTYFKMESTPIVKEGASTEESKEETNQGLFETGGEETDPELSQTGGDETDQESSQTGGDKTDPESSETGGKETDGGENESLIQAQILDGDTPLGIFLSLEDAFLMVEEGQTIQLIQDVFPVSSILVSSDIKSFQLDFNGYMIYFFEENHFINHGTIEKLMDSSTTAQGGIYAEGSYYCLENTGRIEEILSGNYVTLSKEEENACIYNTGSIGSIQGGVFIASTFLWGNQDVFVAENIAALQEVSIFNNTYKGWQVVDSPAVEILNEDCTPKGIGFRYEQIQFALDEIKDGEQLKLLKDISTNENLQFLQRNFVKGISIDFSGYVLEFLEQAVFLNNGYIASFYDSTWSEHISTHRGGMRHNGELEEGDAFIRGTGEISRILSGRYETTSGDLFQITGEETQVVDGAFRNSGESGSIFQGKDGFQNLSLKAGTFISDYGNTIGGDGIQSVYLEGGQFVFSKTLWEEGEYTIPEGKALTECSIKYMDIITFDTGWEIKEVSVITEMEEEETKYYMDFYDALEEALEYSISHKGKEVRITLNEDTILNKKVMFGTNSNIVIHGSKNLYTLKAGEDCQEGLFSLYGGNLTLKQIRVNGNGKRNTTSLIEVEKGSNLTLTEGTILENHNTKSKGGAIFLNKGGYLRIKDAEIIGNISEGLGGGIYVSNEAFLELSGFVKIAGNAAKEVQSNIYLEKNAVLLQSGDITGESRIGITQEGFIIMGVTKFCQVNKAYAELVSEPMGISAFFNDGDKKVIAGYLPEDKLLLWVEGKVLLPESGFIYWEILTLLLSISFLMISYMPKIRKRKNIGILFGIGSLLLFTLTLGVGISHYQFEQQMIYKSEMVLNAVKETNKEERKSKEEALTETIDVNETMKTTSEGLSFFPSDGRNYEGIVSIPDMELNLLVLAEYSEGNMKQMPCVYNGSREENNLIIVGHNYNKHFGKLNQIKAGTEVILTDGEGMEYRYTVEISEVMEPSEVERMITGDWDLTLFTCTFGNEKRLAVRCKQI